MIYQEKQRTKKQSKQLLLAIATIGRHYPPTGFTSEADVREAYRQRGIDFDVAVEVHRTLLDTPIPFENILPEHTWTMSGEGMTFIAASGEEVSLRKAGAIVAIHYEASFNRMLIHIQTAANGDPSAMLDATESGFNSVEDYVRHRVQLWNAANPNDKLIDDRTNKVSFSEKMDIWIPKMAGCKLDKSDDIWRRFSSIHHLRDQAKVHKKTSASGWTFAEMSKILCDLDYGVAGILIRLHLMFHEPVSSMILRTFYSPPFQVD